VPLSYPTKYAPLASGAKATTAPNPLYSPARAVFPPSARAGGVERASDLRARLERVHGVRQETRREPADGAARAVGEDAIERGRRGAVRVARAGVGHAARAARRARECRRRVEAGR